jgi:hypothetical protein
VRRREKKELDKVEVKEEIKKRNEEMNFLSLSLYNLSLSQDNKEYNEGG